jgi:hypothetical protein
VLLATITMVNSHITAVHREAARRAIDGDAPGPRRARF